MAKGNRAKSGKSWHFQQEKRGDYLLNIRKDIGYPDHQKIRRWLMKNKDKYNSYDELVVASAEKMRDINKS